MKKMKNFLSLVLLALLSLTAYGQNTEGVITYEERVDYHRQIPPEREQMKSMIPQFRITKYQLFFSATESLYKPIDEEEEDTGRGGMRFRMPKFETHIDKSLQFRTMLADFMGKKYLVVDTLSIAPWKMGNEKMDILGYPCQMAYYTDQETKKEITAWFTPMLPPFQGPEGYVTLPGTILALDINNGEQVWVARKIDVSSVKANDTKKPEKGEVISRKKYNDMVKEQTERMRQMWGGGSRTRN
jgi:GLPGLI family protein